MPSYQKPRWRRMFTMYARALRYLARLNAFWAIVVRRAGFLARGSSPASTWWWSFFDLDQTLFDCVSAPVARALQSMHLILFVNLIILWGLSCTKSIAGISVRRIRVMYT